MDPTLSEDAKSIISQLLTVDTEERLGAHGYKEVMEHPFFRGISWKLHLKRKVIPPFVPEVDE